MENNRVQVIKPICYARNMLNCSVQLHISASEEKEFTVLNYFETMQQACDYREAHQLFAREAEFIEGRGWALVFPIKAHVQVIPHAQAD